LAFVSLWASGDDPERDTLVRVSALRLDSGGTWRTFSSYCRPASARSEHDGAEPVGARIVRQFGVHADDVATAPPHDEVLHELGDFLAGSVVLSPSRIALREGWSRAGAGPVPPGLALSEIAELCLPGRFPGAGESLAQQLLAGGSAAARAPEATHLRAALGVLVARILAQGEAARAVLAHGLGACALALAREDSPRAADVALVLDLLERPDRWRDPERALEPESYELREGRLSSALAAYPALDDALEAALPRWTRVATGETPPPPPSPRLEEERTLGERDRRHVDEIFQEHLPRHIVATGAGESGYRPGQHGVASVIAEGFGRRELRLVHAPTGTGKTLAYLVPVALWAQRNHARVGIATFTRVLQEQAMRTEAPLALELLRAAAGVQDVRISVLKGRQNYLCWRALLLQARDASDPAEDLLAWTRLALFALLDEYGDLDRFPTRPPLGDLPDGHRRASERLLRAVRSESGCCTLASDRSTCAAEAAWRTAERAHVVLTNHALALARRDFFQHLVFDECEHLHDVALNAFSTTIGLREIEHTLSQLHGAEGRRPLARILAVAPFESDAAREADACVTAIEASRMALAVLRERCEGFKRWRRERVRERREADHHSLFREHVEHEGEDLLQAHARCCAALAMLAAGLARLQEALDVALPTREVPRLRRSLEVLRVELEEQRSAVTAWIPRDGSGAAAFGPESFHDLETNAAGDDVLATRVLLPHEYLGRYYYPTLAGAVLLSATTWLRGGFDAAAAYLGVSRAAEPAPEEEREPVSVASFRAPEAFDYSRVLVAIPRDAPPVQEKQVYLDYLTRFLAYLGERTRGRMLGLFTNAEDAAAVGTRLEGFFRERRLPFFWQRMRGATKEELGQLFRARVDSTLLGLDAFWFGADFPGATLEYLVITRLPYGVPDRYHHAQCAALGAGEQRSTIYLPRALAKFRQGFGRLMRKESDRGCVYLLDKRLLDPRHRLFLRELPLSNAFEIESGGAGSERLARLVQGDTQQCLEAGLAHMGMKAEVRRRGLEASFEHWRPEPHGG